MSKKILLVDDEIHIRLLLQQTLEDFEDRDVKLLIACNGEEALEIIKLEKPELIYLDVMMPKLDGFDVCRIIKSELKLDNIYIALLTAKGQEHDKEKGFEVGADEYITEPFDPDFIISRTAQLLNIDL